MSLENIAAQARRALIGTKAKRGMLFVYPITHSAFYLGKGTVTSQSFQLGRALSVSRDGEVTAHSHVGDSFRYKGRPSGLFLISQPEFRADAAAAAYAARGEAHLRAFKTIEEAREFLRPFLSGGAA